MGSRLTALAEDVCEEEESCHPVPGSHLAGKAVPGARRRVLAVCAEPSPSAFIHVPVLRTFSSCIVPQSLSKGFMPPTCAKRSGLTELTAHPKS